MSAAASDPNSGGGSLNEALARWGADCRTTGIIIIDHGSRRAESNDLLLDVVEAFAEAHDWPIVEAAHMELAEPTLESAFDRCVAKGARLIIVLPYFLGPGRHWDTDIPALAAAASDRFGAIPYRIAAPLGLHPLMMKILQERLTDCLSPHDDGQDA